MNHLDILVKQNWLNNVLSIRTQGCNWLPKTGWAILRRGARASAAPSILPKSGWAIAHPTVTPLEHYYFFNCRIHAGCLYISKTSYNERAKVVVNYFFFSFYSTVDN